MHENKVQQRLDNKLYKIKDNTWKYKLPKIISENQKHFLLILVV